MFRQKEPSERRANLLLKGAKCSTQELLKLCALKLQGEKGIPTVIYDQTLQKTEQEGRYSAAKVVFVYIKYR